MQNLEEDIDNLFRKAAEQYTPRPDEAGWEEIAPQLVKRPVVSAAPVISKKHSRKTLLLLLLLPFGAALFGVYISQNKAGNKPVIISAFRVQKQVQNNTLSTPYKKKEHQSLPANDKTGQIPYSLLSVNQTNGNKTIDKNKNALVITNAYQTTPLSGSLSRQAESVILASPPQKKCITDSAVNTDQTATSLKKEHIAKHRNLYIGIAAGPAFNEVKNQGFKKAGFDAGLLAGYQLTKKVSLEAGFLYSEKYYFSNGQYFNMRKMPASMKVLSLSGSSHVFEIPVALKYEIVRKQSSGVFAIAGLSSYLLTKESNNYVVVVNGAQQNMKGLYKKVSAGFASSVHLGIGYEHNLGKAMSLRAEPYVQVPLKGLGVGTMQVMGAGVRMAVTLPVH